MQLIRFVQPTSSGRSMLEQEQDVAVGMCSLRQTPFIGTRLSFMIEQAGSSGKRTVLRAIGCRVQKNLNALETGGGNDVENPLSFGLNVCSTDFDTDGNVVL